MDKSVITDASIPVSIKKNNAYLADKNLLNKQLQNSDGLLPERRDSIQVLLNEHLN